VGGAVGPITASDPGEDAAMFEPAEDKIYRHPTFYDIPDGITHICGNAPQVRRRSIMRPARRRPR
jgi:1,2-phenylacetyl-CoA epoxidase PaaB subunit